MRRAALMMLLLLVVAFCLATWLQPRLALSLRGRSEGGLFKVLFGESRRMFANQLAVKADVYLHSGFYPSMFDQAAQAANTNMQATLEHDHEHEHGDGHDHDHAHQGECTDPDCHEPHDCDTSFMGPPRDWYEKMGRNFMVTEHSHLEGGRAREILPWLKFSAELDPQRIETYTVAAYWLSERLGRPKEAEEFLRVGLRANPQSHEILFELGKIYAHHFHELERARGVLTLALRRWDEVEGKLEKPDKNSRNAILGQLAEVELEAGNPFAAIRYMEEAKRYSPSPDALNDRISDIWLQLALPPAPTLPSAH